jgi:hypothetical protein
VTNADFGESWQGKSLDRLKHQWGNPQSEVANRDGTSEVRYELFRGGCTYWFTTNASGTIVAYHYKVNGLGTCKPVG